uniref:Putative cell wall protein n=1 Tax=Capsicum chinense TaxID=80379 RepID=Q5GMN0_CAPCH|nr:putative cell wall protein [Capsicum chinense]
MGSKTFLLLGLFLAIFLMITSEVVARELSETPNSKEVDVDGVGGDHYYKGGGYKHKGCYHKCKYHHCCTYEKYMALGIATESQQEVEVDGGYKPKKKCHHYCHGHCCTYEEYMAMEKDTGSKPQN